MKKKHLLIFGINIREPRDLKNYIKFCAYSDLIIPSLKKHLSFKAVDNLSCYLALI